MSAMTTTRTCRMKSHRKGEGGGERWGKLLFVVYVVGLMTNVAVDARRSDGRLPFTGDHQRRRSVASSSSKREMLLRTDAAAEALRRGSSSRRYRDGDDGVGFVAEGVGIPDVDDQPSGGGRTVHGLRYPHDDDDDEAGGHRSFDKRAAGDGHQHGVVDRRKQHGSQTADDGKSMSSPSRSAELNNYISLDTSGDFQLFWDVDPLTETIFFRVEANIAPSDLFAFGFSAYGEPTDADLCVLWTGIDGKHRFQDMHTDHEGRLLIDEQQDYHLDRVHVTKDGVVAIEFHRLYDTCDEDDYLIDTGTTHMVYFTVAGVLQSIDGLDVVAIRPRLQRVQLLKSQVPDVEFPADTKTFVMHVDDVVVPTQETTYWCALRKLPEMKEKHHIIQFQGAISEAGQGVVHHLEVFHCQVPADVDIPYYDAPCSSNSERPRGLESCSRVIGAWAMGANPLSYPAEAGVPIGGPNYSRYVMIEVHYNNPEHRTGIVDNSGIKFHYTRTLRRYDAGIMELGLEYIDKMALPPGQALWKLNGYCIPECTSVSLPADGIKIFASQLHTHLTGLRAYTKHYRNGVELPELNRDNHYSPHYQEIRKLPRPVTVLPGDALITTCEDQTVDRKEITLGGFSISDEMCVNYVHYYPLVDLEVCKSSVTTDSLYEFFRFMNKYQGEPTSKDYGISDNYKSIRWTPMNVHLLETFYDVAPLSMQCNQSDGRKFPGEWENTHIPKILFPMPPEERLCLQ